MNTYMKNRWAIRRANAIIKLGSKCVKCGTTEDLEFDHIDPSTKLYTIAKAASFSEVRFNTELDKCQLLCTSCHKIKSRLEGSKANKQINEICKCGYIFTSTKQKAGHLAHCKMHYPELV